MKLKKTVLLLSFLMITSVLFSQNEINPDGHNIFYYENGNISSEGPMRSGKPDGYWKTYQENGGLKSEGNRESFLLDSTWKFYNDTGTVVLIINYKKGQKNGLRVTYREKEIIAENFTNDLKQGPTTYYYPDSTIFKTINFVDGREDGMTKEFAQDGRVITITTYKKGFVVSREKINRIDGEGRKQGFWKFFYDNGHVKNEGKYLNDLKNGYFKEYNENGKLISTAKWVDGVIQEDAAELTRLEVVKDYYPDGSVKIVQTYRNGVPEGVRREYGPDGDISAGYIFKDGNMVGEGIIKDDGLKNGEWKDYFNDGSLKAEGAYTEGVKIGKWNYYHANSRLEQTGKYDNDGKLTGKWVWYYPSGNILREEYYIDGLADGLMTEFTEEGEVIAEGEFIEGMEEGPWIYVNGDYREEGEYSYGLRNGIWKSWYPDETLKFEGEFIDDNPNGKHVYYWDNGNIKDEINYLMGMKEGDWKKYNLDGTLFLVISYENGIEKKYDGVKIKPEFEE
nr:hypothetical protein [Bacteroidota bacterium]